MTFSIRLGPLIAGLMLLVVAAPVALGHAEIEESNPADGSTITTPLKGFVSFDEEVSSDPARTFVVVVNSAEVEVARGEADETDATRVDLQLPQLPDGTYTLRWQATTTDDNGVERGDFTFTVAAAAATGAPTPALTSGPSGGGNENGEEPSAGNDLTLALMIAALAIAAVLAFVFLRMRRR